MKQSNLAVKWLSYTSQEDNIHIEHVRNGGEKRVGKYSLDGYCEERHTAYEFQGCFWHDKLCKILFNLIRNTLIYYFFHRLFELLWERDGEFCKWKDYATAS